MFCRESSIQHLLHSAIPIFFIGLVVWTTDALAGQAEVRVIDGVPVVFVDGKPRPLLVSREQIEPEKKTAYLANFASRGVDVTIYATGVAIGHESLYKRFGSRKDYLEKYYFQPYDKTLYQILKDVPNTMLLIQLLVDIRPRWQPEWCKDHPDELAVWPPDMKPGDRVSITSELWRKEVIEGLKDVVTHFQQGPYRDRVLGFFLCGGQGEWGDYWDYSKPAQAAFRKWTQRKYRGDLSALKAAWNQPQITFEAIALPAWARLSQGDDGIFYDPRTSRCMIDYLQYYCEIEAEVIADFARAIKEASGQRALVGAWNGAMFYPGWDSVSEGLHGCRRRGAVERLQEDPNLDFFIAPYSYRERQCGGVYLPQFLSDSMILHGKVPLPEDDTRTCMTRIGHPKFRAAETAGDNFGWARTLDDTLAVLRRNCAAVLAQPGSGMAWYSIGGAPGMAFDDPRIFHDIQTYSTVAQRLLRKDQPVSQVAVVYSNRSFYHLRLNLFHEQYIIRQTVEGLSRLGAPIALHLDSDLLHPKFPFDRYKFYVFVNDFYLPQAERRVIAEKVMARGNVALWLYAAGFVTEDGLSTESMSRLVGMRLVEGKVALDRGLEINLTNYRHSATSGLSTATRFGTADSVEPVFWCEDDQVVTLGEAVATSPGVFTFHHPKGLCLKQVGDCTSVWSAAPNLPSPLLRNLARLAGVHIYDDGDDVVYASQKVLVIHTRYEGERVIHLPRFCNVYDPFAKKEVATQTTQFRVHLPRHTTAVYLLQ